MFPLDDERLDWPFLQKYRFDAERFRNDVTRIRQGTLSEATSVITGRIDPPLASRIADLVDPPIGDRDPRVIAGVEALSRGEVAVLVLNGGMATRFGGVVKGVVEVFGSESFLSLKAEDVRRASETFGRPVPFVLMNSFATNRATWSHVEDRGFFGLPRESLLAFDQSVSIRIDLDGSLFIGDDGRPSYHAPGHGDFFECIRASRVLDALRTRGIRVLLFSNVDNLGATIDPAIIGWHLLSGCDMSVEVTGKRRTASGAWDKGGAPATVDGRLQLVEGFRFPKGLAQESLPDFSTNNMLFSTAAIDRHLRLERHVVRKTVDGRAALQLESITCEASALSREDGRPLFELGLLRVPRDGPRGRFFPIKEPQDLESMRSVLRERLDAGWRYRAALYTQSH